MLSKILSNILSTYARVALLLHKPKIVGITGSVGKSSTKEAIALVLSQKLKVRASAGNLNSQIGLPLAVLGFRKPGGFRKSFGSAFGWLAIIIVGFFKIWEPNYPKVLVLEMGTDRPGDIARLLEIVGYLDVAVITDIGISHLEFFKSEENLAKEKLSLLKGLGNSGVAALNADNPKVLAGQMQTKAKTITYGFENSDVCAQDFQITEKGGVAGITFKVNYLGHRVPFFIPGTVGKPVAYASLAATAVGLQFGLNLVDISQSLEKYISPAGRLRIIPGIHSTTILDDTYNAAPASTIAALETLRDMQAKRKLAAIGHMAELGDATESGHRLVAGKISDVGLDMVFLVGEKTRIMEDELKKKNFPGKIFWFENSTLAAEEIMKHVNSGDAILVKGSQSARMEKIVKKLMERPEEAGKLLVRQSSQWLE
jgi:UDP-N-acetylmuramoyl-tripeptide--D-alanyl-D-alanine ligase